MPTLTDNVVVSHPDTNEPTSIPAGSNLPEWAEGLVGAHVLSDDSEADCGEAGGYGRLKVSQLRAEIAERNKGRDEADLIPAEGNKVDLVAALESDDANK